MSSVEDHKCFQVKFIRVQKFSLQGKCPANISFTDIYLDIKEF